MDPLLNTTEYALSGLQLRLDTVAHNIANANTPLYRSQKVNFESSLADALRSDETQAAERPGLEERLKVLDQRLVQIEQEIAVNGEQLANAPAEAGSEAVAGVAPSPGRDGFLGRASPNTVVFLSFLLLLPVVVRLSRRFIAPNRRPSRTELAEMAAMRERMDKLDGALDAVAIEVERIGEGQRFLTQAMTENIPRVNAAGAMYEPVPVRQRDAAERR